MAKYYYNQNNYNKVRYDNPSTAKKETVATSGCGVCSACIALNNLAGKELYSVSKMAKISIDNKARDNSGTNMFKLLSALVSKDKKFTFATTSDESKVISHLKKGGIAICNQGDKYNVFSTAGHFVVAIGMSGGNIEIYDPQMYAGKYDAYSRPKRIMKKTAKGCVVKPSELAKATQDRNPAYFLCSYKKEHVKKKTSGTVPSYKKNSTYTLQSNMRVRSSANGKQILRSKLTANAKKYAQIGLYAVLKKGTKVTCLSSKKMSDGNIWIQIPSGWVCAYSKSDKKQYVK